MRQRIRIIAITLGLLTLIACSSSTTTPAATTAPSGSSPAKISVTDPWARAAAMTGASTSGATGTMT
ncbi:MAG: hypothetical protein WCK70_18970, partial [Chloroflexales bacterium]